jgi:metal-sulfur cluster biosynthetic enzyme
MHLGPIKRIGTVRIRAMELMKTLLAVLSKIADVKNDKILSNLLRKKVIDTMLHVLRTYPYCSVAHQQAIISLNAIKEAFEAEDVQVMKDFVQEMITEHDRLTFNAFPI